MTHISSYEVFSLTFWRLASFSMLQNIRKLCHFLRLTSFFSSSSRHLLEGRTCVESVWVRADMLAGSCILD